MPTSFMNCLLWLGIHAQPTAPFVFRYTSQRECSYKFSDKACSLVTIPALSLCMKNSGSSPSRCTKRIRFQIILFVRFLVVARKYAIKLGNKLLHESDMQLITIRTAHCVLHPPTYRLFIWSIQTICRHLIRCVVRVVSEYQIASHKLLCQGLL